MKWQSAAQLRALIGELVSWGSETLTEGEARFPHLLKEKLEELPYFQQHPQQLQTVYVDEARSFLSAFYRKGDERKTIVLISHFDTVSIEEYGDLKELATQPERLTEAFKERPHLLSAHAQRDLNTGDYLFGRGVMDMKMGLALHLNLMEKAMLEEWPINLLLVTVPDEEVNSLGMRGAVSHIAKLKQEFDLDIVLHLNSEPSFSQDQADIEEYIYTGSIGKIMPAALFYGKETHVGEPLKGITATFMNAYLTAEMEWNEAFIEECYGEKTPLPVTLQQKDLKHFYSTQTPYRSYSLYNVFLMKLSAEEVMAIFCEVASDAMAKCQARYEEVCRSQNAKPIGEIKVLTYEALLRYSNDKLGQEAIQQMIEEVMQQEELDERQKCIGITDQLMIRNQELAPATVLLFAPPYYPAVDSEENPLVDTLAKLVLDKAHELDIPMRRKCFFNGISDLSYCQNNSGSGWVSYEKNTPTWKQSYSIPFEEMRAISAPVMNVGPYGQDAHQISERLHMKSAFEEMPQFLELIVKKTMDMCKVK